MVNPIELVNQEDHIVHSEVVDLNLAQALTIYDDKIGYEYLGKSMEELTGIKAHQASDYPLGKWGQHPVRVHGFFYRLNGEKIDRFGDDSVSKLEKTTISERTVPFAQLKDILGNLYGFWGVGVNDANPKKGKKCLRLP